MPGQVVETRPRYALGVRDGRYTGGGHDKFSYGFGGYEGFCEFHMSNFRTISDYNEEVKRGFLAINDFSNFQKVFQPW